MLLLQVDDIAGYLERMGVTDAAARSRLTAALPFSTETSPATATSGVPAAAMAGGPTAIPGTAGTAPGIGMVLPSILSPVPLMPSQLVYTMNAAAVRALAAAEAAMAPRTPGTRPVAMGVSAQRTADQEEAEPMFFVLDADLGSLRHVETSVAVLTRPCFGIRLHAPGQLAGLRTAAALAAVYCTAIRSTLSKLYYGRAMQQGTRSRGSGGGTCSGRNTAGRTSSGGLSYTLLAGNLSQPDFDPATATSPTAATAAATATASTATAGPAVDTAGCIIAGTGYSLAVAYEVAVQLGTMALQPPNPYVARAMAARAAANLASSMGSSSTSSTGGTSSASNAYVPAVPEARVLAFVDNPALSAACHLVAQPWFQVGVHANVVIFANALVCAEVLRRRCAGCPCKCSPGACACTLSHEAYMINVVHITRILEGVGLLACCRLPDMRHSWSSPVARLGSGVQVSNADNHCMQAVTPSIAPIINEYASCRYALSAPSDPMQLRSWVAGWRPDVDLAEYDAMGRALEQQVRALNAPSVCSLQHL